MNNGIERHAVLGADYSNLRKAACKYEAEKLRMEGSAMRMAQDICASFDTRTIPMLTRLSNEFYLECFGGLGVEWEVVLTTIPDSEVRENLSERVFPSSRRKMYGGTIVTSPTSDTVKRFVHAVIEEGLKDVAEIYAHLLGLNLHIPMSSPQFLYGNEIDDLVGKARLVFSFTGSFPSFEEIEQWVEADRKLVKENSYSPC